MFKGGHDIFLTKLSRPYFLGRLDHWQIPAVRKKELQTIYFLGDPGAIPLLHAVVPSEKESPYVVEK